MCSQVNPQHPILDKISEGYPEIGHMYGYAGISSIKLGYAEISQSNQIESFIFEHNL